jgi:hypothetical protein
MVCHGDPSDFRRVILDGHLAVGYSSTRSIGHHANHSTSDNLCAYLNT